MPSPLPPSSAEPFDLVPAGNPVGTALLFHGFTGSPYEVLPLGVFLQSQGIHAVGPLLPGHGRTPLRLAEVAASQWMDTAREALFRLTGNGRPVVVGGLSMGGLVAASLAAAYPERVRAVVLMASALRLYPQGQLAIRLSRAGAAQVFPVIPKGVPGGDCGDPQGRALNPSYQVIPMGGLKSLGDMQRAAASALPLIRCPALVVHGALDRTVPVTTSYGVARKLGRSRSVQLQVLMRSRHLLPLDHERDELFRLVWRFMGREGALAKAA
ncbi:MAG: alpha/beta fold hydrolase [Myxococcota bacterium]